MKKHLPTVILVLVFFLGISLMLYPTVSDWWNSKVQTRAIVDYDAAVDGMGMAAYDALFEQAGAYNERLAQLAYPLSQYGQVDGYDEALSVPGSSAMGYVSIDKINVRLPIYHGTSDAALAAGVGHLQGSSLPTGGEGTHAVLSAHRGLPSARLFTDLDKLQVGDTFTVSVLNRVMTYQVDQILIVEPTDTAALAVVPGKDLCTLLTCTPYGINTQRLLVRGVRVENPQPGLTIPTDAYRLDSLMLAPVVAAPMLLVLLVWLLVRYRRPTSGRKDAPGLSRD